MIGAILEIFTDAVFTSDVLDSARKLRRTVPVSGLERAELTRLEPDLHGVLVKCRLPKELESRYPKPLESGADGVIQRAKTFAKEVFDEEAANDEAPNAVLLGQRDSWYFGYPVIELQAGAQVPADLVHLPALSARFGAALYASPRTPVKGKRAWMHVTEKSLKKSDLSALGL